MTEETISSPPCLSAPSDLSSVISSVCTSLENLERIVREGGIRGLPLFATREWSTFAKKVRNFFKAHDYLVIKGLSPEGSGVALLLTTCAVGHRFRTYRGGRIVKHFTMSPWTTDLSHTTKAGEFHTDLNTEPEPPAITAIQCIDPDPGAPRFGNNRVVRLASLLDYLHDNGSVDMLDFLTQRTVCMLNDRTTSSWNGIMVENGTIRYHPETLRAAVRRSGTSSPTLEDHLAGVASAAMAVSTPFVLEKGDILLLSNRRTLHYRGACSVVFKKFPLEFDSRKISVLHTIEEYP